MQGTGRPGRFATQDVLPDGAADDVDFQRAVQRLEEQQPSRAGWLDPRGAFDKGDQAYLREVEERRRHVEEAQAARETNEFLSARAKAEREEEEKRIRAGGGILSAGLASKKPGIDAEQRGYVWKIPPRYKIL